MSRIISLFMDDDTQGRQPSRYGRRGLPDSRYRDSGLVMSRREARRGRQRTGLISTLVVAGTQLYTRSQDKKAGISPQQQQIYSQQDNSSPNFDEDYPRSDFPRSQNANNSRASGWAGPDRYGQRYPSNHFDRYDQQYPVQASARYAQANPYEARQRAINERRLPFEPRSLSANTYEGECSDPAMPVSRYSEFAAEAAPRYLQQQHSTESTPPPYHEAVQSVHSAARKS